MANALPTLRIRALPLRGTNLESLDVASEGLSPRLSIALQGALPQHLLPQLWPPLLELIGPSARIEPSHVRRALHLLLTLVPEVIVELLALLLLGPLLLLLLGSKF